MRLTPAEYVALPSRLKPDRDNIPSTSAVDPLARTQNTDEARLNKTERAFLVLLRDMKPESLWIQSWTFKLAYDCRYTPDFVTLKGGKLTAWEVKGFMRDDALVKLKVAARMFSCLDFMTIHKIAGGWKFERVCA